MCIIIHDKEIIGEAFAGILVAGKNGVETISWRALGTHPSGWVVLFADPISEMGQKFYLHVIADGEAGQ
jgi:hypothetical protein